MQCNYTEAIIFLKAYNLNRRRRVWKIHIPCKAKTCTCIINATYISLLACFALLVTFTCCFQFYSFYAFLMLVWEKGQNKEMPRKQSKGKRKKTNQRKNWSLEERKPRGLSYRGYNHWSRRDASYYRQQKIWSCCECPEWSCCECPGLVIVQQGRWLRSRLETPYISVTSN